MRGMEKNTSVLRLTALDALRGGALWVMAAYHLGFDLHYFGLLHGDIYRNSWWIAWRSGIVSVFLFCAGMGQGMAAARGQPGARFWRRWRQIVWCAAAVSGVSLWMFPHSWISFGVLHGMAVMLILTRFVMRRDALRGLRLPAAALCLIVAAPLSTQLLHHAPRAWQALSVSRAINWIGIVAYKPVTEDFVPLLPWLGVMLLGAAAARSARVRAWAARMSRSPGRVQRVSAFFGRHSLIFYMLHQPVLFGGVWLMSRLLR